MATVSLCMIVKDEEEVIARCLASVADLMDEIVVVDTGSTDRTKEIVRQYTDQLYDFAWIDDFAAARNFSFSKATSQYCMWLDADDLLLEVDRAGFRALKESLDPAVDQVTMPYNIAFDEKGKPTFSYHRERLVRNNGGPYWVGAIHEVIIPAGERLHATCAVTHRKEKPSDPDRNLRIFEKLLERGEALDPRQQFYYARELYYHARYDDAVRVFERFLEDGRGWVENEIDACSQLATCYYALGDERAALRALLRSLACDEPRAEICCALGRHFLDRGRYTQAIFWYELALTRTRDDQRGGFVSPDCYGFLPSIQLCVCYDKLGNTVRAREYNEQAAAYKPDSAACQQNRAYFARRLGAESSAAAN